MRTAALVCAVLAISGSPTLAQETLPAKDCRPDFVSKWLSDKDAALKSLPKQPCWMRTQTGPYVCYKDGCVRANVYFEQG